MNPHTHRLLTELREKTGKEYGKLVQKLLAIALLESEVEALVDRSTQGIDLEVKIAGARHAFEVKTSETHQITLAKKDLEGLDRQLEDGALPFVVVLFGGLLDEWLFVRYFPGELPSGKKLSAFRLRPFRDPELERRVRQPFERAVEEHANTALLERQPGLDRVLAGYSARSLA